MRLDLGYALRYIRDAEQYVKHQERLVESLRELGQEAGGEAYLLDHLREALRGSRVHLFDMIIQSDPDCAPDMDKKFVSRKI